MTDYFKKICLGTVQFGMDYGIANRTGKIQEEEAFVILDYAQECGIDTIDTAASYGDSETVIGKWILQKEKNVSIITKISKGSRSEVVQSIDVSRRNLHVDVLEGCFIHSFDDYLEHPEMWEALEESKRMGKVRDIGFSLYTPRELNILLEKNVLFDIVQVPYSIFDRRFEPYFEKLKERGVTIYARSIFLQGLVFMMPDDLSEGLFGAKEQLVCLKSVSDESKISKECIALEFVLDNPYVDKVIFGIDGISQMQKNIEQIKQIQSENKVEQLSYDQFIIDNEKILLPYKWGV